MGMTIEEALNYMPCLMEACSHCLVRGCDKSIEKIDEAKIVAIETVRKYQKLQADYETRLKADMMAMLTDIQLEIEELYPNPELSTYYAAIDDCSNLIQQKIDKLKEVENGND